MNKDDIELLFHYNDWANDRILDTAEKVSQEQLKMPNDLGWGSLRGALVHILDAEYGWRKFLAERVDVELLTEEHLSDVASIRMRWRVENQALWAYLGGLTDEDVSGLFMYEGDGYKREGILWHFLAHVVNHGTQHRAECAALLTGFGHSPGNLDFIVFLIDK